MHISKILTLRKNLKKINVREQEKNFIEFYGRF